MRNGSDAELERRHWTVEMESSNEISLLTFVEKELNLKFSESEVFSLHSSVCNLESGICSVAQSLKGKGKGKGKWAASKLLSPVQMDWDGRK